MSQWNYEQSYNNAYQNSANFHRYPLPPFNENRMIDPRGLPNTSFNYSPTPFSARPFTPPLRSPAGRPPESPPFFCHVPPPPYPPPAPPPVPSNSYHCPRRIPGPFSRPPPMIGRHPVAQNPHITGFTPNGLPPNYLPPTNLPPLNCPPPIHPVPNCPRPAVRFDPRAMAARPMNTYHQRPPSSSYFGNQQDFRVKRHLNTGYNWQKVGNTADLLRHVITVLVSV